MAVLHSYARAVEMFAAGALDAEPMVSHAFALADYGDAVEAFSCRHGAEGTDQAAGKRISGTVVTGEATSERAS
jgi:hypothetical protein